MNDSQACRALPYIQGTFPSKVPSITPLRCSVSPNPLSQNHLDAQNSANRPIISAYRSSDSSSIPVPARMNGIKAGR